MRGATRSTRPSPFEGPLHAQEHDSPQRKQIGPPMHFFSSLSFPADLRSVVLPYLSTKDQLNLSLTCRVERLYFYSETRELRVLTQNNSSIHTSPIRLDSGNVSTSVRALQHLCLRCLQRLTRLSISGSIELPSSIIASSLWSHALEELRLDLNTGPELTADDASLRALGRLLTVLGFREEHAGALGPVMRVLSLKGCQIDEHHVVSHLHAFRGLTRLSVSSCRLPTEAMRSLIQVLRDNLMPRLEYLEISRTPVEAECVSDVAALLSSPSCPDLSSINFSADQLHGERGAQLLRAFTAGTRRRLTALNLGHNGLNEIGGVALASVLGPLPNTQQGLFLDLRELRIAYNFLRPSGIASLAPRLHFLPSLTHLDLRGTYMQVTGMQALAKALGEGACPLLRILDLADNRLMTAEVALLSVALARGAAGRRLERLHLERNPDLDDDAADALILALENHPQSPQQHQNTAKKQQQQHPLHVLCSLKALHVGGEHRIQPSILQVLRSCLQRGGAVLL